MVVVAVVRVSAGKTAPYAVLGPDGSVATYSRKDDSETMRKNESGIVDSVMLTTNEVRHAHTAPVSLH